MSYLDVYSKQEQFLPPLITYRSFKTSQKDNGQTPLIITMQIVQNVTRLSKLNVCLKFLAEPDSRALHYFNKKSVYTEFPTCTCHYFISINLL